MKALWALLLVASPAFAQFPGTYPIGTTPTVIVTASSMATTVTSPTIPIWSLSNIDFQEVWTGTPTGYFSVNISQDKVNWDPLPLTNTPSAAGVSGHASIEITGIAAPYIQLVYTPSGGAGFLTVTAFGKVKQ